VRPSLNSNVNNNEEITPKKLGGCTGKGFMPGQSGNPSGRPKKKHLTEAFEEMLEEKLQDPDNRRIFKEAMWLKTIGKGVVSVML